MPPSSSRSDCDAGDEDWAPKSAVKVNISLSPLSSVAHIGFHVETSPIACEDRESA